jgi:hypothetical protein
MENPNPNPHPDPQPSKSFRFQYQRAIFTYKTHINKEKYISWLTELRKGEISFIRLAHETGDEECPYEHTHVVVDFGKRIDIKTERYFDFDNIHPHIKGLKSKKAFEDAKIYISKEDPNNADLKEAPSIITKIWKQESLQDALMMCKKPSDAIGIKTIYENKPIKKIERPLIGHPWQVNILEILVSEPDPRKIYWIYDPVGNSGKSNLVEHLMATYPNEFIGIPACPSMRDFGTILQNHMCDKLKGVLFDLPRNTNREARSGIYEVLECTKNGMLCAVKYSGRVMLFDRPHVVVMANYVPDTCKMSKDRWVIWEILNDSYESRPLTLKEVGVLRKEQEKKDPEPSLLW